LNTTFTNVFSNIIARIWSVGIGIILIPVYTNILGIEAYGLIGFYSTLVGSLAILDLGLSSTLNRELARSNALNTPSEHVRNLVFSLECIYWIVGFLIGIIIVLLAPYIAVHWVKAEQLSPQIVQRAIMLMGGIIAFQWSQSVYTGGLMGLQKQVSYNMATVIINTVKSVGAIFVLKFISPTITTFFTWQALLTITTVFVLRRLLWHHLPKHSVNPVFSMVELKKIWKFAAGMTGISLSTFCLLQVDKIVLSKMLSLEDYGYYTLAWTVGTSILLVVGILGNVLLPKITEIVAQNDDSRIINTFHKYNKLMASVVVPVGLFIVVFSKEIIGIWTQNSATTDNIWLAVSILTLGSICNAFMHIPYYLMLAYGETKFTIYQNIIASIILTPLLFWWTSLWGLTGATLVWFCVNFGYNIVSLPIIHKYYITVLKGKLTQTYFRDMFLPIILSISLFLILRLLCLNSTDSEVTRSILPIFILFVIYIIIVAANQEYRRFFVAITRRFKFTKYE
jgi:O-antigen/teichoic acid export membrane protein